VEVVALRCCAGHLLDVGSGGIRGHRENLVEALRLVKARRADGGAPGRACRRRHGAVLAVPGVGSADLRHPATDAVSPPAKSARATACGQR
jgi:hypothetical protein